MRDFYMVILNQAYVDINSEQRDLLFIPYGSFGYVEEILPGQAFLISSYIEIGEVFPGVAITFVDEKGDTRYLGLQPNHSDEGDSHFFSEFENRTNELAGVEIVFSGVYLHPSDGTPSEPYLSLF